MHTHFTNLKFECAKVGKYIAFHTLAGTMFVKSIHSKRTQWQADKSSKALHNFYKSFYHRNFKT
jgi:hypothetical protein